MERNEIIRMALEAGGVIYEVDWCFEIENLERFAALVAAYEREACAKVCAEDMGWLDNGGGELCSKAIRARGEE